MIRKIVFAIVCFTFFAGANAGAQELNIWVDGGPQGLSYKVPNGSHDLLSGGSLGLGYTFPLTRHWGIVAGVSGGFYSSRARLNDGTYSAPQVDNTGSAFRYDIKATGYTETQRFFSFGVPLMLQYHSTGAGTQWYINGGAKLLLPLNATVKGSAQQLALSGYYPDYNLEVSNLPQHGFGTVDNWKGRETYKLKTGVALDAETGVSFALGSRMRLYTGLYLEYGLTDMKGTDDGTSLVSYGSGGIAGVKGGSVWNGPAAGDAKLLSYGVMVKLGFGFGHRSKGKGRSKEVIPQPASVPDTTRTQRVAEQPVAAQPEKPKEQEKPKEPQQPQAVKLPGKPAPDREEAETMRQSVVFGILGRTSLPKGAGSHLDEVVQLLNKYPDVRLAIIGHTCSIGTETENYRIGEARARAVALYLQSRGIDPRRMDVRSEGESLPAFPNDSAANRSRNRRVTVLLMLSGDGE